jgi:hypothetical protein
MTTLVEQVILREFIKPSPWLVQRGAEFDDALAGGFNWRGKICGGGFVEE